MIKGTKKVLFLVCMISASPASFVLVYLKPLLLVKLEHLSLVGSCMGLMFALVSHSSGDIV